MTAIEADNYDGLSEPQAQTLRSIHDACRAVYGRPALNNTMRPPCFSFFFDILASCPAPGGKVDYLEIGSFQGASMVSVGSILRTLGRLGSLCSVDPYFAGGYHETPPGETEPVRKRATPRVMKQALQLYETVGLDVEHVRDTTPPALIRFIKEERKFDFIFIDGSHEKLNPMVDMALSLQLIRPGGYIMMDDSKWPDIRPVVDCAAATSRSWPAISTRTVLRSLPRRRGDGRHESFRASALSISARDHRHRYRLPLPSGLSIRQFPAGGRGSRNGASRKLRA